MRFEYKHIDKVKEHDGMHTIQSRLMGILKQGVAQQYESGLQKIKKYFTNEFDPARHTRFLRVGIWHFDATRARYFMAANPIFVSLATFSKGGMISLLLLDAVIMLTLCTLLGLCTHDDSRTEGESLLAIALQVEEEQVRDRGM